MTEVEKKRSLDFAEAESACFFADPETKKFLYRRRRSGGRVRLFLLFFAHLKLILASIFLAKFYGIFLAKFYY